MKALLFLVVLGAAAYFFMHSGDKRLDDLTLPVIAPIDPFAPENVVKVIGEINSPEDVQRHEEYFTPQGRELLLWLLDRRSDAPMSSSQDQYSRPIIRDNVCDIALRSEKVAATIRLSKTDHWRFHDFYLDKAQGREVGLWVSYMKEHPYGTAWTMLWK